MTPQEYYYSLPPITKYYGTISLALALLTTVGLVKGGFLALQWYLVIHRFHVWRLFTTFVYLGPVSLNFLFSMMLLMRHAKMVEEYQSMGTGRGTAEMMWLLGFGCSVILATSYLLGNMPFLASAIIFYLVYIWSRQNSHQQVEFYGTCH